MNDKPCRHTKADLRSSMFAILSLVSIRHWLNWSSAWRWEIRHSRIVNRKTNIENAVFFYKNWQRRVNGMRREGRRSDDENVAANTCLSFFSFRDIETRERENTRISAGAWWEIDFFLREKASTSFSVVFSLISLSFLRALSHRCRSFSHLLPRVQLTLFRDLDETCQFLFF